MGAAEGSRVRTRFLALAASFLLCLALTGGCGGGSPESTGTVEEPVAVGPLPGAISSADECDLYAAVGGSDARGDGSRERPWEHVDFLVSELTGEPGRAVGCLRSGTYTPTSVDESGGEPAMRFDAPGVTLTSLPGERARVVGRIFVSPTASGVTISNLDLATQSNLYPGASCAPPCGNASFSIAAPGVTVAGNDISNDATDICLQLVRFGESAADGATVAANRIHDCGPIEPKRSNTAHAIYVNDSAGSTVTGNLIYDTGAHGVKLGPRAVGTTVSDNVIDSNAVGVLIGDQTPCPAADEATRDNVVERNVVTRSQVRNNIEGFWVPAADSPGCFDIGDDTRGNVVSHNCVYADNPYSDGPDDFYNANGGIGLRDPAVPESGGFEDDGTNFEVAPAAQPVMPPIYADPLNDDFHLLSADGDGNDCLEADEITDLAASANARWGAPTELAAEPGAGDPVAAMGPDGVAAVAWEQGGEIRAIVRGPGSRTGPSRWGSANPSEERPEVATISAAGGDAASPEIAAGGSGAGRVVVAVWSAGGEGASTAEAAVWSRGSWGEPQKLSGAGEMSGPPAVAVADDGAATVIWPEGDTLVARTLAPGAAEFGGAQSIPAAGSEAVRVAAGADGSAVAVWRGGEGERGVIGASRFDGTSWSPP
ncbi:MAG: right-handed parallel beta-helix repeat-containing protein, partial [Solirubrobacterales bacterium]